MLGTNGVLNSFLSVDFQKKTVFQERHQIIKQFGSRSGPTFSLGLNCLQRLSADDKSCHNWGKELNTYLLW